MEEAYARLQDVSPPVLDLGSPGELLGDKRLFDNVGGHLVLSQLGVGVGESGGLASPVYGAVAGDTVDAAFYSFSIAVPGDVSWRVHGASLYVNSAGGVLQPIGTGRIRISPARGSPVVPLVAGGGTGVAALVPLNPSVDDILIGVPGAPTDVGLQARLSLVARPGTVFTFSGDGSALGDVARGGLVYTEWPATGCRPPV